jgi:ComF family protein
MRTDPPEPAADNAKSLLAATKAWLNAGLAFFYPEACQLCGQERAGPAEGYICGRCQSRVQFIQKPYCERCGRPFEGAITSSFECEHCRESKLHFRSARSAVAFKDEAQEVIHRYKYQHALWFEPFLSDLLARVTRPELEAEKWDFIVPVPLHPTKQRERGFNQAERLAACLGRATGIPMNSRLLRRVTNTPSQTKLSREQREANMRNAFAPANKRRLNGARIVVLDDVFTTGATTNACAQVLKRAGAAEVCVWTVARGI